MRRFDPADEEEDDVEGEAEAEADMVSCAWILERNSTTRPGDGDDVALLGTRILVSGYGRKNTQNIA